MPGFDRPDPLKRVFHELVVQLREARGWDQAGLVARIQARMKGRLLFGEQIDVAWLQAIETNARTRRISPALVEMLANALECNEVERRALKLAVFPTFIFGEQIAYLRTHHKPKLLSRSQVVRRLDRLEESEGKQIGEEIGEGWLRQIEEGRKARISRVAVELLAKALECNWFEEFKLLLAAGQNPLSGSDGTLSQEVEHHLLMLFLMRKHPRGPELFEKMVMSSHARFFALSPFEMFDLFQKGLALLESNDEAEGTGDKEEPSAGAEEDENDSAEEDE